jgi:hypothetical protein
MATYTMQKGFEKQIILTNGMGIPLMAGQAVSLNIGELISPFLGEKGRLSELCLLRGRPPYGDRREPQ